ncbi:MFS transporter [Macrococcus carouselicus]|uniref:MFS transporter n=1 Tax=Macrococcus carouselicus TaxID=69969 RepID=A0A9Q8CIJ1_9STAP|nr:MFS transporter [Macrococcus carouselicus]TDM03768.1 MFS transporter [Macrococcus carouselicus]
MQEIFKLLLGRIATNIGDSIILITLTWYISQTYEKTVYLGYLGFIIGIIELLIIFIGPIIDRYSIKAILLIATFIQIIIVSFLTFLLYLDNLNLLTIYILISISVLCSSIIYPAENTIIPSIVRNTKEISKVNSVFQISYKVLDLFLNSLIGFLLAIILLKTLMSITIAIFIIALYLFLILNIPKRYKQNEEQKSTSVISNYFQDLRLGLKFVKKPLLLKLLLPLTIINFAYAGGIVIFPKLGEIFGGSMYYGIILLLNGLGVLVGYLVAPNIIAKVKFNIILPVVFLTIGICWIGISISYNQNTILPLLFLFLSSITLGILNLVFITAFQIIPPENLLGRVNTTNETLISLLVPFGSLFGSILADTFSTISFNFFIVGLVSFGLFIFYSRDKDIQKIYNLEKIDI